MSLIRPAYSTRRVRNAKREVEKRERERRRVKQKKCIIMMRNIEKENWENAEKISKRGREEKKKLKGGRSGVESQGQLMFLLFPCPSCSVFSGLTERHVASCLLD